VLYGKRAFWGIRGKSPKLYIFWMACSFVFQCFLRHEGVCVCFLFPLTEEGGGFPSSRAAAYAKVACCVVAMHLLPFLLSVGGGRFVLVEQRVCVSVCVLMGLVLPVIQVYNNERVGGIFEMRYQTVVIRG
jgi:hypothetical protein